jgi:hypothetical protein
MMQTESQMSGLPDAALAEVLKNLEAAGKAGTPEYIIAAGELQTRNDIRKKYQAAQTPERPPVLQELLAPITQAPMQQMAPEMMPAMMDQGVAGLPAQNMENIDGYADGGIVAFQGGGQSSLPFDFDTRNPVGAPLQSTRVPGPGPTLASAFSGRAMPTSGSMPGFFGRLGALALGPLMAMESITGPTSDEITRLKEFDRAKEILKQNGFTDKDIAALKTPDVYRMAKGYGYQPISAQTAPAAPTPVPVPAPAAPAAPGVTPPAAPQAPSGITVAPPMSMADAMEQAKRETGGILGPVPLVPDITSAVQERVRGMTAAGYDPEMFKKMRADIEKEREESKGDKREAVNLRLLEAGLGILGGESPYAFVNIGKGATPALKGLQDDIKDLKKVERDRNKAVRDLQVAENQVAAGIGGASMDDVRDARSRLDRFNQMDASIRTSMANSIFTAENAKYLKGLELKATETYRDVSLQQQRINNIQEVAKDIMARQFQTVQPGTPEYEDKFKKLTAMLLKQYQSGGASATEGSAQPNIVSKHDEKGNRIK